MASADQWHTFHTAWGWMASAWREKKCFALTFGHASPQQALRWLDGQATGGEPAEAHRLKKKMLCYIEEEIEGLAGIEIDIEDRTPFQQSVLIACREIPSGETSTYQELAQRCGRPRAARAVGNVMRTNRHPLIIPCHRVVGASGKLVGYSAPGGLNKKEELLGRERIAVTMSSTCHRKGKD
jgi:methylated-DNA-[protein]-cysteine S-methyltransferase